jgi:hypothetical protein
LANSAYRFTAALVAIVAAASIPAFAATTPTPSPTPHAMRVPTVHLPNVPLHTEVVVEVNKKGQVVRVKSTKPCKVQSFNVQTFGNALQMWIRRRDGSAEAGLYRVYYDYDPKTAQVSRRVALISSGGSWANEQGAANVMIDLAHKQAVEAQKQAAEEQKKAQEQNAKLPSLNQIRGVHTATPSPKPTLPI